MIMRQLVTWLSIGVLLAGAPAALHAQKTTQIHRGGGGSPHVRTEWTIDGASIRIEYGRPFMKGRTERQMMPDGYPWRTGADEATIVTSDKSLTFGALTLKPGTYTINTIPGDKAWQLLIGRFGQAGQWGIPYLKAAEIGRTPMRLGKTLKPIEQLTISIDDTTTGAILRIEWATASATVPFTVK